LNDYIHYLHGRRQFCIDLQSSEEHFDAFKDVDESVLAFPSVLSRLRYVGVRMAHKKLTRRIRTERRTLIPANITLEGGNTCKMNMSMQISD
jgi:hypothetical protein